MEFGPWTHKTFLAGLLHNLVEHENFTKFLVSEIISVLFWKQWEKWNKTMHFDIWSLVTHRPMEFSGNHDIENVLRINFFKGYPVGTFEYLYCNHESCTKGLYFDVIWRVSRLRTDVILVYRQFLFIQVLGITKAELLVLSVDGVREDSQGQEAEPEQGHQNAGTGCCR